LHNEPQLRAARGINDNVSGTPVVEGTIAK
jgi:hypothetical protein